MKNTKRFLAYFLAVLMTLSCFAVIPVGATEATVSETASVYDPNTTATLSDAVDGVIYIDSANEFMAFANVLNSGNNFAGKTIKLTCDIVINQGDVSTWTNPVMWSGNGSGWGTRFAGSFDGQGHVISGVYNEGSNNAGFFGRVVGGTEFKNVTIVNSKFISWGGTDGKGLGGLIGSLDPNWAGVTTTISNVHIDAIIDAPQGMNQVGGIIGGVANHNSASVVIKNSSFTGTISSGSNGSKSSWVGGLVGYMKGVDLVLENCSVDADMNCANNIGGLVGRIESSNAIISNCLTKGNITANSKNGSGIAYTSPIIGCYDVWENDTAIISNVVAAVKCTPHESLIATARGGSDYTLAFELENIVYDSTLGAPSNLIRRDNANAPKAKVNNSDTVHGTNWALEGQISRDYFNTTAKTTDELKGSKVFDFWTAVKNDYPTPPTASVPDFYNGTATTNYITSGDTVNIYTAEQFMGFANTLNGGTNFSGKTIKLHRDVIINKGDSSTWGTTAPAYSWNGYGGSWTNRFAGSFDGQGHVISGIYNKHDTAAGMFGRYAGGTEFKNVNIVNSYFESTGVSGDTGVGAIFGLIDPNWGAVTTTISNVHVDAQIVGSSSNVYSSGGFVGRAKNHDGASIIFENCSFNGTVNAAAAGKVGGFVGHFGGNNLSFTNCSVNADLTAYSGLGGLAGRILLGTTLTVSDCLVVSNITAGNADTTAGVIGYYSTEYGAGNAQISNTLVSVRGENVLAAVLGHWGNGGRTLTVTLDNVKYDANRFNGNKMRDIYTSAGDLLVKDYTVGEDLVGMTTADLKGQAIFDGWTAVPGDYPVPAAKSIDSLKTFAHENYGEPTQILGYQTKLNDNGTYAVRLIATLTNKFDENYVAAGFKDIKITLANGQVKEIPVYYCQYAYTSVIGAGNTYVASEYLSDSFFCLTVDNAPTEISSIEATPFVVLNEETEPACGDAIAWGTPMASAADQISVMSLNVYLHDDADPDGDGPKTASDRINALQAQILAQDPDVICVQEDNWTTKLDSLLTTEGYTAVRGKAISRSGWTGNTYESYEYQTIYFKTAKFTLEGSGQKWLSDNADTQYSDSYGTDDTRPRGINYAKLTNTESGETFYVFNVHLENAVPTTRMNQAAKLVELVGSIAGETPSIMCGDFNLISNTSDENDKTAIASLKTTHDDSRIVADLTETHATFINAESTIFGAEGTTATATSGTIIDYCFTSKNDFHVYSYDVISEKQDGIYTSDHLPLVIKLTIN